MKKLPQSHLKGIAKLAKLNEMGSNGQIQTDADDTDHSRDTPDKAIDGAVDAFDGFQHKIFLSSRKYFFILPYSGGKIEKSLRGLLGDTEKIAEEKEIS